MAPRTKESEESKPHSEETGTKTAAAPAEETVVVSKAQLGEILSKLERLESAADKARLESFDNKNRPKGLSRVRLNLYEDPDTNIQKVVMAWKMLIDEVVYDRVRGYIERQIIQLTLEDGTKVEFNYSDFAIGKRRKQLPAEIVSRSKDEATGNEMLTLRRVSDQKEYKVDSRFIN